MGKKALLLAVVVVVLCGSAALALDPMGPPAAGLNKGQFSAGIEYSYSEQTLIPAHGREWGLGGDSRDFDQEMSKYYARFGYGISDKTEGFLRVGFTDYEYERFTQYPSWKGDDDTLALGIGIKTTFSEESDIKWGGLIQMSWISADGKRNNSNPSSNYSTGDFETEMYEFQLAAGPTCQLMPGVSVYGGPFMHIVDGEHKFSHAGDSNKMEIEENASFGGYIGTQIDIFNIEYIYTDDADGLAAGLIWTF